MAKVEEDEGLLQPLSSVPLKLSNLPLITDKSKHTHTNSGDWLNHFPSANPIKYFTRKTKQPIV